MIVDAAEDEVQGDIDEQQDGLQTSRDRAERRPGLDVTVAERRREGDVLRPEVVDLGEDTPIGNHGLASFGPLDVKQRTRSLDCRVDNERKETVRDADEDNANSKDVHGPPGRRVRTRVESVVACWYLPE